MPNNEFTSEMLRQIMPTLPKAKRDLYAPMLQSSMTEFKINNERRVAAYLANLAHESKNLTRWEENLSYSAKRMTQVWPNRFKTIESAQPFANNPEALANKVYGGRMGNNRNGDGWKYRGRFPLQATGKDMYVKASRALNIPKLVTDPDSCMNDPSIGFRVSAWIFAVEKRGNLLADSLKFKALVYAINGGYTGLPERIELFNRALRVLPDDFRLSDVNVDWGSNDDVPDYIEEAETEESDDADDQEIKEPEEAKKEGLINGSKPAEETAGTPPPTPAQEVKASEVSFWAKISSISIPAGLMGVLGAVGKFFQTVPPWGWIMIISIGIIIGYLVWRRKDEQAHERTKILMTSAADQEKNNLRLI